MEPISLLALVGMLNCVLCYSYDSDNGTLPSVRQMLDFKLRHPHPQLLTLESGSPVEIRDVISGNSDLMRSDFFFNRQTHLDGEIVPFRIVQSKGMAAWGYFEVTNDDSKYTKADVFNGVGKKTLALARLSVGSPGTGGSDLGRNLRDLAVKLYTNEGIFDLLAIQTPVFAFRDPVEFADATHAFNRRNPATNLIDLNTSFDISVLRPETFTAFLYILSDYGVPNGWIHADFFPIHAFELVNKHGERWYAKFSWRTELGRRFLTDDQIVSLNDPDHFTRQLYNTIANNTYPTWRLDMDVLSLDDIQTVGFNPFDVTKLWKRGTYKKITIGKLVLNKNSDNQFRDAEQAAFNPSNLVPGIPGPIDQLFRGRRVAYRDTQNYRIGRNHLKVGVNSPDYAKTYVRDGHPPVGDNMKDAPIYYQNSFNGPVPVVDDERPVEQIQILESRAVDLQEASDLINKYLDKNGRQRLLNTIVLGLTQTTTNVQKNYVKLLKNVDPHFGRRVEQSLRSAKLNPAAPPIIGLPLSKEP